MDFAELFKAQLVVGSPIFYVKRSKKYGGDAVFIARDIENFTDINISGYTFADEYMGQMPVFVEVMA